MFFCVSKSASNKLENIGKRLFFETFQELHNACFHNFFQGQDSEDDHSVFCRYIIWINSKDVT